MAKTQERALIEFEAQKRVAVAVIGGALLGGAIGGPLGAVAGLVIGAILAGIRNRRKQC